MEIEREREKREKKNRRRERERKSASIYTSCVLIRKYNISGKHKTTHISRFRGEITDKGLAYTPTGTITHTDTHTIALKHIKAVLEKEHLQ